MDCHSICDSVIIQYSHRRTTSTTSRCSTGTSYYGCVQYGNDTVRMAGVNFQRPSALVAGHALAIINYRAMIYSDPHLIHVRTTTLTCAIYMYSSLNPPSSTSKVGA
jgi:hypothetical protein